MELAPLTNYQASSPRRGQTMVRSAGGGGTMPGRAAVGSMHGRMEQLPCCTEAAFCRHRLCLCWPTSQERERESLIDGSFCTTSGILLIRLRGRIWCSHAANRSHLCSHRLERANSEDLGGTDRNLTLTGPWLLLGDRHLAEGLRLPRTLEHVGYDKQGLVAAGDAAPLAASIAITSCFLVQRCI